MYKRQVFLQLDDKTTLLPTNMTKSPYGEKEVRALVNYKEVEMCIRDRYVVVNLLSVILFNSPRRVLYRAELHPELRVQMYGFILK